MEERREQREGKAAKKKKAKAKSGAKCVLWLMGIGVVAALWHFAVLPVWALVAIAVVWSMLLSGFFGDIL